MDIRGRDLPLFVTPLAIARHGVELVATVDKRGVVPGTASVNAGVDLSFLHGAHQQSGLRFRVVGHRSPIRFVSIDGNVSAAFLSGVRKVIETKL